MTDISAFLIIGFYGGLRYEEILIEFLTGMLKCFEETRLYPCRAHAMVKIQGIFKGDTGYKWHMVPLVENNQSAVAVKR